MQFSKLGMGCAPLGELFATLTERESLDTVDAAYAAGIRFFDTAPWYGTGKSELRVGAGLRDKADAKILTKVGRVLRRGPDLKAASTWKGGLPFEVHFDYTRAGVLRSFEDSLQRLGMPKVEALAIHDLDLLYHHTPEAVAARFAELEGDGFAALEELKRSGDTQYLGAGINRPGLIPEFLKRFPLDYFIVAMPYTLLNQDGLEELNECHRRGVRVIIGAPFASGLLASGAKKPSTYDYAPAQQAIIEKAARLEALCEQHDVPLPAAALQFVLAHPAVVSAIPGFLNGAQAQQAVEYVRTSIPRELWDAIRNAQLIHPAAPTPAS
jgi:D-threo-aldose 1-dehydrogenase